MPTNQSHKSAQRLASSAVVAVLRTSIAAIVIAAVAACANMQSAKAPVDVPDTLKPGADESLAMIVSAKGVQVYECRAKNDAGGNHEWVFVGPAADLFSASGSRIGKHYAGPHWESNDGSKIIGTVKANAPAPTANAIPWLLLTTQSAGPEGAFSKVTSVQRVSTVGGVAPRGGCSQATVGTLARELYTADYYFFAKK
jgi:hypothetical protein